MKMSPVMLIMGGLMVFWASVSLMVIYPALTMKEPPSEIYRPETLSEAKGLDLYVENGCSYCHSLFIRTNDWVEGASRIAERGDYIAMRPAILGTERVGSDLSEEGGEHPVDWHLAHFINPRTVSPLSLMPSWEFMGREKIALLTAYVQSLGGRAADYRVERQRLWKERALAAWHAGPDSSIAWLHAQIPPVWLPMPNPYGATDAELERGHKIYQQFCIGCHGAVGDGNGSARPWIDPPPLNFTTLRRHLIDNKYIGGIFYYQVMNGITGTAMPYFKRILESEKIWAVSNYIAVSFVGYTDAGQTPRGIEAAGEAPWKNPYSPPDTGKGAP
jgi:cbb3-type cytochrome c oxidase subunit II